MYFFLNESKIFESGHTYSCPRYRPFLQVKVSSATMLRGDMREEGDGNRNVLRGQIQGRKIELKRISMKDLIWNPKRHTIRLSISVPSTVCDLPRYEGEEIPTGKVKDFQHPTLKSIKVLV